MQDSPQNEPGGAPPPPQPEGSSPAPHPGGEAVAPATPPAPESPQPEYAAPQPGYGPPPGYAPQAGYGAPAAPPFKTPAPGAYPPPEGQAPGYGQAPTYGQPAAYSPQPDYTQQPAYHPGYGQQAGYGQQPGYGHPGGHYQAPAPPPPAAPEQPQQAPFLGYARQEDWDKFTEEFTKIDYDKVIPLGAWLKDKPWNLVWVRWFLAYALFPYVLLSSNQITLEHAAWGFGVYFALTWLIVLTLCIKPERVDVPLILLISVFTAVAGVWLVLFGQKMPIISSFYGASESKNLILKGIGYTLGVALLEETVKALPLLLFVFKKKHDYRPLTFAYLGVVSGLAFGVKEAVLYSTNQYPDILRKHGLAALGVFIMVQLLRLISLPLLHACWSGIVGYFVGLASRHAAAPRALLITGLGIAVLLHGVYDTFSNGWTGTFFAGLTVLVFISYVRSGDVISKDILAHSVGTTPESQGVGATATGPA